MLGFLDGHTGETDRQATDYTIALRVLARDEYPLAHRMRGPDGWNDTGNIGSFEDIMHGRSFVNFYRATQCYCAGA